MPTLIDPPTQLNVAVGTLTVGQWCIISGYTGVFQVLEKRATDVLLIQYSDAPASFGTTLLRANNVQAQPIAAPTSMTISWAT